MRDQLAKYLGVPVYTETLSLATAEVYRVEGMYCVFLVGDRLASFVGNSPSLEDCKAEIKRLKDMMEPQVVTLNDLIISAHKMLAELVGEGVELTLLLSPTLRAVKANPIQIEQVLVTLAISARNAMPRGGKLSIATANIDVDAEYARLRPGLAPGPYAMISVSDNGTGMTAEEKASIFKASLTPGEEEQEANLGLTTCYSILQQHQGHISVYSEPGQGTTFKVYLPFAGRQAPSAPTTSEDLPTGNETVLVVEDEGPIRELASRILQEQGYTVLEASNGVDALRAAQEHIGRIDILLTDMFMPRMGGKELAEHLRAARPDTKVLYMSGYTDDAVVMNGMIDANTAFMQKPFTLESLAQKVRRVLDQK
jgi:two-component system cell cycle sensor histidine kinase/response regulator CckA